MKKSPKPAEPKAKSRPKYTLSEGFAAVAEYAPSHLQWVERAIDFALGYCEPDLDEAARDEAALKFIRAFAEDAAPLRVWFEQHEAAFTAVGDKVMLMPVKGMEAHAPSAFAAYFRVAEMCHNYAANPGRIKPARFLELAGITLGKVDEIRCGMDRERVKVLGEMGKAAAKGVSPNGKRIGKRPKTERDSDEIVLMALVDWHGYENGAVKNYEQATNRGLADHINKKSRNAKATISGNALTRFLKRKSEGQCSGREIYKRACGQDTIGPLLARWLREPLGRNAELRPGEE